MIEGSFKNVVKVIGVTDVFEDGEKCNCPLTSMCFSCFCAFGRVSIENDLFVNKVGFRIFVKLKGSSVVFENG